MLRTRCQRSFSLPRVASGKSSGTTSIPVIYTALEFFRPTVYRFLAESSGSFAGVFSLLDALDPRPRANGADSTRVLFLWRRCVCQPEGLQSDVKRSIPRMAIASVRQHQPPTRVRPSRLPETLDSQSALSVSGSLTAWPPRAQGLGSASSGISIDPSPRSFAARRDIFYAGPFDRTRALRRTSGM